jgi:hypothetical protein
MDVQHQGGIQVSLTYSVPTVTVDTASGSRSWILISVALLKLQIRGKVS